MKSKYVYEVIFVRLKPEVKRRVLRLAQKDSRSMNNYVALLIDDETKRRENAEKVREQS